MTSPVAGDYHTVALLSDGTVVATGDNTHGQCNVGLWENITDVYAMNNLTVGVQADGTVTVAAPIKQNENKTRAKPQSQVQQHSANDTPTVLKENHAKRIKVSDNINFEWKEAGDGIKITKYKGNEETVVIPETIHGKPVRVIGVSAFFDNSTIKHLALPKNLWGISQSAFDFCVNLREIVIPDSVQTIGRYAFASCVNLREIVIPDSVQTIGKYAFAHCKNIKRVEISPKTRKRVDPRGEILPK